jgi:DNA primase
MKTQNVAFKEAIEILARQAGVTLRKRKPEDPSQRLSWQSAMAESLAFFKSQLSRSTDASSYCQRRGISADAIELWEIGYAPDVGEALAVHLSKKGFSLAECQKLFLVDQDNSGGFFDKFRGRLIFPIRDERGELVAFGGRIIGDGHPKYINSSDTPLYRKSRVLYGMNVAKKAIGDGRSPVICEGYLDVIACHEAGVSSAVASLGTALSEEHAKMLVRWAKSGEAVILYDADEAGEKAAARGAEVLEREGLKVRVALMPQGEDPDTLLKTAGAAAVVQAAEGGLSPTEFKVRQIEVKVKPDDEAFWKLAVEALAECRSELEIARQVQYLAPKYPHLRDPVEARKALRRMIAQYRKAHRAGEQLPPTKSGSVGVPKLGIKSAEASLFRAFVSEEFRGEAFPAILQSDLFLTGRATELASAITSAFSEVPKGKPAEWLHAIEPAEMAEFLAEIDLSKEEKLTEPFVKETIALLERKREERALQALKTSTEGDEKLKILQAKLRDLKT